MLPRRQRVPSRRVSPAAKAATSDSRRRAIMLGVIALCNRAQRGEMSRWSRAPSFVSRRRPSVCLSSRPTGRTAAGGVPAGRQQAHDGSVADGLAVAVRYPAGLCSSRTTCCGLVRASPSMQIVSRAGSICRAGSKTGAPLQVTRPARMRSFHCLRLRPHLPDKKPSRSLHSCSFCIFCFEQA